MRSYELLTFLPLLSALTPSLAAPTEAPKDVNLDENFFANAVFEGPFPINYTQSTDQVPYDPEDPPMSIAASCYNSAGINTPDIDSLYKQLQAKSGNQYVPKTSWVSWSLGSAIVCVYNNYIFENTHVSFWEMGWGAKMVREQCCYTPYCGGGSQQGHGDSGLAVNIVTRMKGSGC